MYILYKFTVSYISLWNPYDIYFMLLYQLLWNPCWLHYFDRIFSQIQWQYVPLLRM